MFIDITGKRRLKACLHLHTTVSDGKVTPEKAIELYEKAGYDILAITDHWGFSSPGHYGNMRLITGCEYHVVGSGTNGVAETFHILGLDMARPLDLTQEFSYLNTPVHQRVNELVAQIRSAGGAAILAHPAWSLNAPDQIMDCGDFDGTEIYNSVSEHGMSDRPYSGQVVDMLAVRGVNLPLLATDDTHYYDGNYGSMGDRCCDRRRSDQLHACVCCAVAVDSNSENRNGAETGKIAAKCSSGCPLAKTEPRCISSDAVSGSH